MAEFDSSSFSSLAKIPSAALAYAPPMFFMLMAAARKKAPKPQPEPRVFRFELGEMTVTVHPGDDIEAVRVAKNDPLRYFIDDVEVDQETFDRELNR